jgi:hypothetical protein
MLLLSVIPRVPGRDRYLAPRDRIPTFGIRTADASLENCRASTSI